VLTITFWLNRTQNFVILICNSHVYVTFSLLHGTATFNGIDW
jgi:hypothetical protein